MVSTTSATEHNIVVGAIYQHYKGQRYRVIAIGKHSETLEDVVLYEVLYENPMGRFWCRPVKMWSEMIEWEGAHVPRFKFLFS